MYDSNGRDHGRARSIGREPFQHLRRHVYIYPKRLRTHTSTIDGRFSDYTRAQFDYDLRMPFCVICHLVSCDLEAPN